MLRTGNVRRNGRVVGAWAGGSRRKGLSDDLREFVDGSGETTMKFNK